MLREPIGEGVSAQAPMLELQEIRTADRRVLMDAFEMRLVPEPHALEISGLAIGLLMGLLNVVPYLGTIVGLLLALPLGYAHGGLPTLAGAGVAFCVVQVIESYFITPRIMGDLTSRKRAGERQGHRGRGGIALIANGHDDSLHRQIQATRDRLDDANVGLMRISQSSSALDRLCALRVSVTSWPSVLTATL